MSLTVIMCVPPVCIRWRKGRRSRRWLPAPSASPAGRRGRTRGRFRSEPAGIATAAEKRQTRLDELSDGRIRSGVDRPRVEDFDDAFPTDDLQSGFPLPGVRPVQSFKRTKRLRLCYPRFGDGGAVPRIRGEPVAEANRRAARTMQATAIVSVHDGGAFRHHQTVPASHHQPKQRAVRIIEVEHASTRSCRIEHREGLGNMPGRGRKCGTWR